MSRRPRAITRADLLPPERYAAERGERKRALVEHKRLRRLAVGPVATVFFESYDTVWMQIHEMLHIERGGEAQIEGELGAYARLVPDGRTLVLTLMIEIDDPERRARILSGLGGIEHCLSLQIDSETIIGIPEPDLARTSAAGKASAVHFLHLPVTPAQARALRSPGTRAVLGIGHANYGHLAVLPEATRAALAEDLD
ncbi:MAG: DUF3501 family protein [Rhodospirillaceae bacterium]